MAIADAGSGLGRCLASVFIASPAEVSAVLRSPRTFVSVSDAPRSTVSDCAVGLRPSCSQSARSERTSRLATEMEMSKCAAIARATSSGSWPCSMEFQSNAAELLR